MENNAAYTGDILVDGGTVVIEDSDGLGGGTTRINPGGRLVMNLPANWVNPTVRGNVVLAGGRDGRRPRHLYGPIERGG